MDRLTWKIAAASVQGTSHLEKAIPCQDAHAFKLLPGGVLLAAVADGAGSAQRSQEGAQCAVDQALAGLQTMIEGGQPDTEEEWLSGMAQVFQQTSQSITQIAADANTSVRVFATTLTCVVVCGDWLAAGQIGDGAIVIQHPDHTLSIPLLPQRGEYANEANFLTMPDAMQFASFFAARQPLRALALTTDGMLRLAFRLPGYEPYPRFFEPLLAFAAENGDDVQEHVELREFLASERVCARTDDDKTLLLAVCIDTTLTGQN